MTAGGGDDFVGKALSLILYGAGEPTTADALRQRLRTAAVPVLGWSDQELAGADATVPLSVTADALAELARRWWPVDPDDLLVRLERSMGTAEIDGLLSRLREQLEAASAGDGGAVGAHRIAGIAGMLGFPQLGAAWLAVSHGEPGAEQVAGVETRRALFALSRRASGGAGA